MTTSVSKLTAIRDAHYFGDWWKMLAHLRELLVSPQRPPQAHRIRARILLDIEAIEAILRDSRRKERGEFPCTPRKS